jgi:hypothetical protein
MYEMTEYSKLLLLQCHLYKNIAYQMVSAIDML